MILFFSVMVIKAQLLKEYLPKFESLSGLATNAGKSMCFLSNGPQEQASHIIDTLLRFQTGTLPAKFLGVPLISTKLCSADCYPLIEKITRTVASWTNKFLSYSGRLQLIQSILFAIQSYWSAFFIFPAVTIKAIKIIFSRFLWKGPSLQKFGSKVSWNNITLPNPYKEGGLNIKDLEDWNNSLIMLQLWKLIDPNSTSLWASWVKHTVLRSKYFWCIPIPNDCSWIWRKILKVWRQSPSLYQLHHWGWI